MNLNYEQLRILYRIADHIKAIRLSFSIRCIVYTTQIDDKTTFWTRNDNNL